MSESHLGGFRLPVQKLADTLIFADSRKAKMQASPPLSTPKSVFCLLTKGAFLHDVVRCAERDVRFAHEKEHSTLRQIRNPSRYTAQTASFAPTVQTRG